jgi:transcriptional regulator of acetoin/glycerol metabolism
MKPSEKDSVEAWRLYKSRGRISKRHLRVTTYRAWERCHLLRADPQRFQAEALSSGERAELLRSCGTLIAAATPYMQTLSKAVQNELHAVMLGNAEGIVLSVTGHPESVSGPNAVPGPGSLLTEALAGSNGIGTPLAEQFYVELEGAEHFIEGFHPFTCQGLPIKGLDGETIGVISTSVRMPSVSRELREILTCATHGIEAELHFFEMFKTAQESVRKLGLGTREVGNLRQDILQPHAISRLSFESSAGLFGVDREMADKLLQTSIQSALRFKEQAKVWWELVHPQKNGAKQRFSIGGLMLELEDLLSTELRIHQATVIRKIPDDAVIHGNRQKVRLCLFKAFLEAIHTCTSDVGMISEWAIVVAGNEKCVTFSVQSAQSGRIEFVKDVILNERA